jgi:hypothetical protein
VVVGVVAWVTWHGGFVVFWVVYMEEREREREREKGSYKLIIAVSNSLIACLVHTYLYDLCVVEHDYEWGGLKGGPHLC